MYLKSGIGISLNWLMRSKFNIVITTNKCTLNKQHCNCVWRPQWHHVLGHSRSGIPWNRLLVYSWPRLPQDDFVTHGSIWHQYISNHTSDDTNKCLILYVASGPNPGMIIYGCSSEHHNAKLALPHIFLDKPNLEILKI